LLEIDKSALKRLEEVSKLPAEARSQVFMVIDALIRDLKLNKLTLKKLKKARLVPGPFLY
jgi:hypothetical protein